MFFVGNISCPPTIGLFAAKMAAELISVMRHNCANFFISFFLFRFLYLPCSEYYEGSAGLDEANFTQICTKTNLFLSFRGALRRGTPLSWSQIEERFLA